MDQAVRGQEESPGLSAPPWVKLVMQAAREGAPKGFYGSLEFHFKNGNLISYDMNSTYKA